MIPALWVLERDEGTLKDRVSQQKRKSPSNLAMEWHSVLEDLRSKTNQEEK